MIPTSSLCKQELDEQITSLMGRSQCTFSKWEREDSSQCLYTRDQAVFAAFFILFYSLWQQKYWHLQNTLSSFTKTNLNISSLWFYVWCYHLVFSGCLITLRVFIFWLKLPRHHNTHSKLAHLIINWVLNCAKSQHSKQVWWCFFTPFHTMTENRCFKLSHSYISFFGLQLRNLALSKKLTGQKYTYIYVQLKVARRSIVSVACRVGEI